MVRYIERQTWTYLKTVKETEIMTDKQTDIKTDTKRDRQTNRHIDIQIDNIKHMERQIDSFHIQLWDPDPFK